MFTFMVIIGTRTISGDQFDTAIDAIDACIEEVELLQFHPETVAGFVDLGNGTEARIGCRNGIVRCRVWKTLEGEPVSL